MLARSIVSLSALLIIISLTAFSQVAAAAGSVPTPFADDSGFSVFLPQGWIGEDIDNTNPSSQSAESRLGYGLLSIFCPQERYFHILMVALAVRVLKIPHMCLDIVA
jgi:hypothetical protein